MRKNLCFGGKFHEQNCMLNVCVKLIWIYTCIIYTCIMLHFMHQSNDERTDSVQWSHLYSHDYSVQLLFFKIFLILSPFFYAHH